MRKFSGKNTLPVLSVAGLLLLCLFNRYSEYFPYLAAAGAVLLLLCSEEILALRKKWQGTKTGNRMLLYTGLLLCLALRISFFSFESGDYTGNLSIWYDVLKTKGFSAMKDPFYEYPPAYLYLVWGTTLLPIQKLAAFKLISLLFEIPAAWAVFKITRHLYPAAKSIGYTAVCCFLLFPTVVFNSAVWAQCDIIFTSFLLLALYFFITEKNTAAMLAIGLALSFKIQTVFIVLLPLSLWVQGKLSLRDILLIPAVYVLSILPCFFAGRPFLDLLFVYQQQAGEFRSLTQFAPSVYQFFGWAPADIFTKGGIWFTSCLVFLFTAWVWKFRPAITTGFMIHTATLSSLLIPYFLPRMHERYFFLADVLCLLYAFYRPGRYYVPILTGLSSLFCYFYFLFSTYLVFPFKVMSIMMLVSLIIVARDFAREHILPTFNVQHDSYR